MELVNNYVSVPGRTAGKGTTGYGSGGGLGATGGIDFSSLLQNTGAVKQDVKTVNGSDFGKAKSTDTKPYPDNGVPAAAKDVTVVDPEVTGEKVEDNDESSNVNGAEEMAALLALMDNLKADRVTAGDVELVTERIQTNAKPPSVEKVPVSGAGSAPVVSEQNMVPTQDGKSVTVEVRDGEENQAEKAATLEAERNGGTSQQPKEVTSNAADKYDPQEVMKSLEGQGRMVVNSENFPSGTPSTDTDGPTGRAPGESRGDPAEIAKGPQAPKTVSSPADDNDTTETKTSTLSEDATAAAMPIGFTGQNVQTTQTVQTEVAANETMMMRTTETTVADDLTNLLSARFPAQNGQLTIELDPQNLGKITINVSYDSGHAAVTISATNQKTVELLTQNAPAMANIIQQKTGQQTEVYIPNAQETGTKQDMASGRESNENAAQQQARQSEQQARTGDVDSSAFLQQMRLGLV
ncbi:flagellar hook-length control protein FliK [Oribacterium sp. WCC10]|uniref:flagellar hook-length control protein FliK n=1 Tax=Oribacterium sp. WCC10 TaxID=1855343 RepID=UPI0008E704BD|nr:flagellar hook-length control protein FliK [Oribacterium sp. WCC10]SFG25109.1 hook-length control protein FliK [Oribacterium sp. WCC10]